MIEVMVCCNDRDRYPAWIDPTDHRDGFVKPWFDLETVQRIAEDSQAEAAEFGHGGVDTVHVITGQIDGQDRPLVLNICWMYLDGEKHQKAVENVERNADGLYAVGGYDWNWYMLDDLLNPVIPPRVDPAIPTQVKREILPPFPGQRTNG
ncbi:hypothetical protein ACPCSP_25550 [Streptomyces cinereoruber]|uniref:hypothetical protein n=1 Tax=Streptomyces cinereoruber TaxID=67260 RepID=UPI003C2CBBD1